MCSKPARLIQHGGLCRYGFHKEPAGGKDSEGQKKARLLEIFGHWTDMVTDLVRATPEEDVLRRDIFDRPPIFKWTQVPPGGRRARRWRMLTAVPVWWGGFVRLEKTGACVSKRLRAERGFCFRVMATLLVWQLDGVGAGWHRRKGKRERLLWAVLGLALRLLCSKPYGRPLERLPNDHAAAGPRGAAGRLGARDAAQPGPGRLHGHRGRLPAGHRPGRRGPGRAAPQRAPGHGARAAELPGALRARRAGRELRRDVVLACFWGHAVRVCPRRHGVW